MRIHEKVNYIKNRIPASIEKNGILYSADIEAESDITIRYAWRGRTLCFTRVSPRCSDGQIVELVRFWNDSIASGKLPNEAK